MALEDVLFCSNENKWLRKDSNQVINGVGGLGLDISKAQSYQ